MPQRSLDVQKFEGSHYDAFAGFVPRQPVHGRDLEKTLPRRIVSFEFIDSIPSLLHNTHDDSLISQDSSFDDILSPLTAFPLPTGVGLGILGLTRKEGGDPFHGLGLVHIHRSSRDPSSDGEISPTILREAVLTFLQPVESVVLGHPEPEKTKPVDMPSPQNRPRRSLTRNFSASTVSSSLKRASKTGATSKVDRG
ncbi:hypothetical protein EDD85DRAFT_958444 [Armillaria nabsnona]|nr:hypothetical protein EDD85DRAFT_958444 [Armillaria nabsnona]